MVHDPGMAWRRPAPAGRTVRRAAPPGRQVDGFPRELDRDSGGAGSAGLPALGEARAASMLEGSGEFGDADSCVPDQRTERPRREFIVVRDRQVRGNARFSVNHVASALPQELPTEPLEGLGRLASRDYREPRSHAGFHPLRRAISSASSHAWMASRTLRSASFEFLPWLTQPGRVRHSAVMTPPGFRARRTLNFNPGTTTSAVMGEV